MKITHNRKIYFYLLLTTILVLGFCIGGTLYMEHTAETIVEDFQVIKTCIETENWDLASTTFEKNFEYWNRHKKVWQMFIDHDEVDDIEVSFLALKGYLETKAGQESTKELYLLEYNILHVPATQSINPSNLL